MSAAPLPAFPILSIMIGVGMLAGAGFVWLAPQEELPQILMPELETVESDADPAIETLLYNSEGSNASNIEAALVNSAFASDRSSYSRTVTKPKAPEPTYQPKFVGKTGKGPSIRAIVIWKPGTAPQSISIGDETPWGVLESATASELHFEGPDGSKMLSMF